MKFWPTIPCQPVPVYWMDRMFSTPIVLAAACRTLRASCAGTDTAISVARVSGTTASAPARRLANGGGHPAL